MLEIIIQICLWLFAIVFVALLINEIIIGVVYGFKFLVGNKKVDMLKVELSTCFKNPYTTNGHVSVSIIEKTDLKQQYISNLISSFFTPYYLGGGLGNTYRIIRYSKAYFLVKRKFEEIYNETH